MNHTPDLDEQTLSTALHGRLDTAPPHVDLDALVRSSTRRGGRIRRARWAAAGLGVAAVVAATGFGAAALSGGGATTDAGSLFADGGTSTAPSTPGLADGQTLTLPSGATATVRDVSDTLPDGPVAGPITVIAGPAGDASTSMFLIDAPDASQADLDWLGQQYGQGQARLLLYVGPRDADASTGATAGATTGATTGAEGNADDSTDNGGGNGGGTTGANNEYVPGNEVTIGLDGWTCPAPADDKTICAGPNGASIELVWRADREQFLRDYAVTGTVPMLGGTGAVVDGGGDIVGPVMTQNVFVSVGLTPDAAPELVKQVAESLVLAAN
jgi:hypothetical protein